MHIHWFPGHMTKAFRMMQAELSGVDSVIYVLDARAPLSSINPKFDELIERKPVMYVLNKADLVEKQDLENWRAFFEKEGKVCVTANSALKGASKRIIDTLITVNTPIIERYKARGINKTIRAMVIGVPNCGKSTLINSLIPHKKLITGNKPGVTRGKQWVSVEKHIDLLDTPGTLYPDFSDQNKARNLAFIGSISDNAIDDIELATELLKFLTETKAKEFSTKYSLTDVSVDTTELLSEIGKKKGQLLKGGEIDLEKTAKSIILDFRKQAFGKIILEKV